jgi:hypothetical protein
MRHQSRSRDEQLSVSDRREARPARQAVEVGPEWSLAVAPGTGTLEKGGWQNRVEDRRMKSPFPGMDSYIEACGLWGDFHNHRIEAICVRLALKRLKAVLAAMPGGLDSV